MKTSKKGIDFIKRHEGLRLRTYDDLQPHVTNLTEVKGTLTIGYGHTGPDVKIGQLITQQEAERLLAKDLQWAEQEVRMLYDHFGWRFVQSRFDALVSWVYNTGNRQLSSRNLVKAIDSLDKAEKRVIEKWNAHYVTSKGQRLPGLVRRRKEESIFFNQTQ